MINQKSMLSVVWLVGAATLLGGCESQHAKLSPDHVRSEMSPELETIALTAQQRKNRNARAADETMRQLHDDWDAIWFLDHPLRLSRYPVP